MAEAPLSIRLNPELKIKFQELAKASGLKTEEFVNKLIYAYETAENESIQVSAEKKQVRTALLKIQSLTEAVIDRALSQEIFAKETVEEFRKADIEKESEIKKAIEVLQTEIDRLKKENSQLREFKESVDILKSAFGSKEAIWQKANDENETLKKQINEFQEIQKQHEIEMKNLEIDIRKDFDKKFQDTIKTIIGKRN